MYLYIKEYLKKKLNKSNFKNKKIFIYFLNFVIEINFFYYLIYIFILN